MLGDGADEGSRADETPIRVQVSKQFPRGSVDRTRGWRRTYITSRRVKTNIPSSTAAAR